MNITPLQESQPGGVENPGGGYHIHVKLNERGMAADSLLNPRATMPSSTPVLAEMSVFEDCVLLALQDGNAIVVHAGDPAAAGSVVYISTDPTAASGAVEPRLGVGQLPFSRRLAQVRRPPGPYAVSPRPFVPANTTDVLGDGRMARGGGVRWFRQAQPRPMGLTWRVDRWQHSSLSDPQIAIPGDEQTERLSQAHPADVQQLWAVREQCEEKVTADCPNPTQIGGLNLLLNYVERIGLVKAVNGYCTRQGDISEGTVIAVLVSNRLLSPCPLSRVAEWVDDSGLHLLLGRRPQRG